MITLADVPVTRALLPELADRLVHAGSDDLASKLLAASSEHHEELALSVEERDELLAVLVDPPHRPASRTCETCCSPTMSGAVAKGCSR